MKTNLEKHKHYQKTSRYQFCEIPNDEEGKQLVKSLRKYLNRHVYTIRVKGQYLDKVKHPDTYWDKGAPIDACTHMRVYIDERRAQMKAYHNKGFGMAFFVVFLLLVPAHTRTVGSGRTGLGGQIYYKVFLTLAV